MYPLARRRRQGELGLGPVDEDRTVELYGVDVCLAVRAVGVAGVGVDRAFDAGSAVCATAWSTSGRAGGSKYRLLHRQLVLSLPHFRFRCRQPAETQWLCILQGPSLDVAARLLFLAALARCLAAMPAVWEPLWTIRASRRRGARRRKPLPTTTSSWVRPALRRLAAINRPCGFVTRAWEQPRPDSTSASSVILDSTDGSPLLLHRKHDKQLQARTCRIPVSI